MGFKEITKTITINLLLTVVLLLFLNIISGIILKYKADVRSFIGMRVGDKTVMRPGDTYAESQLQIPDYGQWRLPNYENNREEAYHLFREIRDINSEFQAFTGWTKKAYKGISINVNNTGDRIHTPPKELDATAPVVRFFGPSTMWGVGSADNGTIPAFYNQLNPNVHVHNHGEDGFNSRQLLGALINSVSYGKRTDLAIFYTSRHEISNRCGKGLTFSNGESFLPYLRETEIKDIVQKSGNRTVSLLRKYLYGDTQKFLKIIALKILPKQKTPDMLDSSKKFVAKECADIVLRQWQTAKTIVEANGGKFIAVLQPKAFIGKPKVSHIAPHHFSPKSHLDFIAYYDEMRRRLPSYAVDLTSAFDVDEYIYIDGAHVSENGNRIIAGLINKFVISQQINLNK